MVQLNFCCQYNIGILQFLSCTDFIHHSVHLLCYHPKCLISVDLIYTIMMILFQVLIISYETFRMHSVKFERPDSCDLLICDEAHRLKNDQTLTNKVNLINSNQMLSRSLWLTHKENFSTLHEKYLVNTRF